MRCEACEEAAYPRISARVMVQNLVSTANKKVDCGKSSTVLLTV
jgi:hypothetical protein